ETIEKGARKKLAKKVLSGKLTVDEARAKLGRMRSQKSQELLVDAVEKGIMSIDEARAKMGLGPWVTPGEVIKSSAPQVVKSEVAESPVIDPDIIKNAVQAAIAPLLEKIEKQDKTISEQEARWEAAANLP